MKYNRFSLILIILLCGFYYPVSSEPLDVTTLDEKTSLDGIWETRTGSDAENNKWSPVEFPTVKYSFPEANSCTYQFKREIIFSDNLKGQRIGLYLGRLPDATEVYLNGSLILKAGICPPEGYYGDIFNAQSVLIPDPLINFNGENTLLLQSYTQKPSASLPSIYFCDNKTRIDATNKSRLLNQYLGAIAASMAFLTSLYFLILFLLNRKEKINLFLFLGALGCSLNVSSLFVVSENLSYLFMFKLQNIGLYWGINCVILFIQDYMQRHQKITARRFFLVSAAVMSIAILAMPDFKSALFLNDTVFYMFYIAPCMLYMLYLAIRGYLDNIYFSSVLLLGVILALAGGLRDIGMILMGITPEFYTNTIGMVGMIVCIFIAYAARFNLNKKLAEFARDELEIKNRNIDQMNTSLERFIPREVLSYLDRRSIIEIALGDHAEQMMTVMFTDIRDFTLLSESMNPEENFRFINSYLNRMGPVIRNNCGFVDKYLGDGIMALFPRSPKDAINAALEMRQELDVYNGHRANSGYNSIRTGIGIHFGMLMIGTIGEERRMDSTVISDAVNIASRLESLTKDMQSDILISEEMKVEVEKLGITAKYLGHKSIKGKKEPLAIYSL